MTETELSTDRDLSIVCPECGAQSGEPCWKYLLPGGGHTTIEVEPHPARVRAAQEADEMDDQALSRARNFIVSDYIWDAAKRKAKSQGDSVSEVLRRCLYLYARGDLDLTETDTTDPLL